MITARWARPAGEDLTLDLQIITVYLTSGSRAQQNSSRVIERSCSIIRPSVTSAVRPRKICECV